MKSVEQRNFGFAVLFLKKFKKYFRKIKRIFKEKMQRTEKVSKKDKSFLHKKSLKRAGMIIFEA